MKSQLIIPDYFYLHASFNLWCEFLYKGVICIPMGLISIPAGKMCGINWNETWKVKSQFLILDFFNLHLTFNLHREFIYVGTICIPASMISIPAGNIRENEKSINNAIFFMCMLYLTCITCFYVFTWSVYLRVWSLYPWEWCACQYEHHSTLPHLLPFMYDFMID